MQRPQEEKELFYNQLTAVADSSKNDHVSMLV